MLTTHPVPEGCDPNKERFVNSSLRRGLLTAAISGGVVLLGQGVAHADDQAHAQGDDGGNSSSTKSDDSQKTESKDDGGQSSSKDEPVDGEAIVKRTAFEGGGSGAQQG